MRSSPICPVKEFKLLEKELERHPQIHPTNELLPPALTSSSENIRLAVQRELPEKTNLMRDLTSSVPAIIWQLSQNGKCVFASDYFETVNKRQLEGNIHDKRLLQ